MAGLKAGVVACSHLPKTLVNGGVPECVSVGLASYLGDPGTPAGPVWCPWRGLEGRYYWKTSAVGPGTGLCYWRLLSSDAPRTPLGLPVKPLYPEAQQTSDCTPGPGALR